MSGGGKDALLSPTDRSRTVSPSADSRANGSSVHEESLTPSLPISPKQLPSDTQTSDVKDEPTDQSPTKETVPSDPETEPLPSTKTEPTLPPSETCTETDKEAGVPLTAADSDVDIPDENVLKDSVSPVQELEEDDDSDSDDSDLSEFEEMYDKVNREIRSTSLEEVLEKLRVRLDAQTRFPEVKDTDIEDDEYLYTIDETEDANWKKEDDSESSQALKQLHGMCWRILDHARICTSNHRADKSNLNRDRIVYKFDRIMQRLSLIDDDMKDIAVSTLPTLQDVSYIENLASLIRYLTADGDVTVVVDQVIDEINGAIIWSHYQGFASFRMEDCRSMVDWQNKIDDVFKRWTELCAYVKVYYIETRPLEKTSNNWEEMEMSLEALVSWREGMRELVSAAKKLITYLIHLIEDCRETWKGYYCIQKTIRNNLLAFLNMDISNMFNVKPQPPTESEFLFDS